MFVKNKALVVGINKYFGENALNCCVNDAVKMEELLAENGDGSPNFSVMSKLDIQNKKELKEALNSLFNEGEAEIVLFYFSGHGSDSNGGYLVTPDYDENDFGISMSELLALANNSKSKNKVIILDCCYSGKLGEIEKSNSIDSVLAPGVTIMTASNREEVSLETDDGHGVFTNLLIEGLKGGAADISGNITPASLYSFVDQSLGPWEQRPLFKTNISSFLSIRKIEAKVPKKTLRKLKDYFLDYNSKFQLDPSFEYTNNPAIKHEIIEPYTNHQNVKIFKDLQLLESVGLVEPVGAEHMYFAAMENKQCKLTPLGIHYWNLAKNKKI